MWYFQEEKHFSPSWLGNSASLTVFWVHRANAATSADKVSCKAANSELIHELPFKTTPPLCD